MGIKKIKLGEMINRAQISSFDEADNTIVVIFSTGERGLRGGWSSYYEELEISDKAIRMDRLKKGAPFLKNHYADINEQIGVVVDAWIEGANAMARIRLSDSEAHASIIADIKAGIIKNISVGYRVYKYEEVAVGDGEIPVYRATDWEPLEISAVAIPFDSSSQTRSGDNNNYECEIVLKRTGEVFMTEEEKRALEKKNQEERDAVARAAGEAERKRASEIFKSVKEAGLEASFTEDLISRGVSVDEARDAIIKEMAKRNAAPIKTHNVQVVGDERDTLRSGMEEAILHRAGAKGVELTDNGRRFRNMKLLDMARHITKSDFNLTSDEVIARAFHSTSDFPSILMNATNKALQNSYEEMPQTFSPFVRPVSLSDFKAKTTVRLGDFPALKKLGENGELKAGTISEGKESYKLDSYGAKILINRQTIINDDLGAFAMIPEKAARAARTLESDLVYSLITSNPTMGDAVALFHADHGNLIAAGDFAGKMDASFEAMMKQKGLDGQFLSLTPSILLVPVALKAAAERFVSGQLLATKTADINIYAGRMVVVADPRLDLSSATKWYLIASVNSVDVIELGTLDGQGPKTFMEDIFASGMKFEILHDVGAGLIDHRGILRVG